MPNPSTTSDAPPKTSSAQRARAVAAAGSARARPARRVRIRYYLCLGILVLSAATMQTAAQLLGRYFRKEAVPLKAPLQSFDRSKLGPQYRQYFKPSPRLSDELVESLGTREYLQLLIEDQARVDPERPGTFEDPLGMASVFVTYYTGKPDMVPHRPEECYVAAGNTPVGSVQTVQVAAPGCKAPNDRIPVRVPTFRASARGKFVDVQSMEERTITVMYFFHVNGRYATTRNQVRWAQANPLDRYAYYAKIEVSFMSYNGRRNAGRDESIAALGPLLAKLMPILFEDHLQDWETYGASGGAGEGSNE